MNKIATLVAVGATLLASTAMAQTSSTMSRSSQGTGSMSSSQTSAAQNNVESRQYQNKVRADSSFRNARQQRECGPIQSSELRQQCVDSFASYSNSNPGTMSTTSRTSAGSTAITGSSRSGESMSGTTSSGGSNDRMGSGALRPGADASTPPKSASDPANQRTGDGGSSGR